MKKTVINISGHIKGNVPVQAYIRKLPENPPKSNVKNRILIKQHLIERNKEFLDKNKNLPEVIRKKIEQNTNDLEKGKNILLSMFYRDTLKDAL
jgi:hypothetical protein